MTSKQGDQEEGQVRNERTDGGLPDPALGSLSAQLFKPSTASELTGDVNIYLAN